jgi:hypothetical protein
VAEVDALDERAVDKHLQSVIDKTGRLDIRSTRSASRVPTALRVGRAHEALETYLQTGEVTMVPAYKQGDDRAGMHFKLDDYGLARRGAVPARANEMSEMTWLYWFWYVSSKPFGCI